MTNVIEQLKKEGLIIDSEYDGCFSVHFLTTDHLNCEGEPIEFALEEHDYVIKLLGPPICYDGDLKKRSCLLQALWAINVTNEHILGSELYIGYWYLNTKCGDLSFAAVCPNDLNEDALFEFCRSAIDTYFKTRDSFKYETKE